MKKAIFLSVVCIVVFSLQNSFAAAVAKAPSDPKVQITSSVSSGGASSLPGGVPNTPPIFDPLSSIHLYSPGGSNAFVTIGATDKEGSSLNLSVLGPNVVSSTVVHNFPGRIEAIVELAPSASFISFVTYTVQDTNGGMSQAIVPVLTVPNMVFNSPILFGPISHEKMKVGEIKQINLIIRDDDAESLRMTPALPNNGYFQVTQSKPGYVSGQIFFIPNASQVGVHDILIFADDTGIGRMNSAVATVRVVVDPVNSNSAPTLDPVHTNRLTAMSGSISVNIGATDAEGDQMMLLANGAAIQNFTVIRNVPGRIEGILQINPPPAGFNNVSYTVLDSSGSQTTVQLPMYLDPLYGPSNLPTIFWGITHQTVTANQPVTLNFIAYDLDGDTLDLDANLPWGAQMNIVAQLPGLIMGQINWVPSQYQIGAHDIPLYAEDINGSNYAIGTFKVQVQ